MVNIWTRRCLCLSIVTNFSDNVWNSYIFGAMVCLSFVDSLSVVGLCFLKKYEFFPG